MSYKEILNRLSYLRTQKNLSAREVSLRMGRSESYFYRIESGQIKLNFKILTDILEVLDSSYLELFYPKIDNYKKDMELLQLINNMSESQKDSLTSFIKQK